MLVIIWRTIKDRKISIIVYSGTAALLLWMYVALFPSFKEQAEALIQTFESFPKAFFQAFGIEDLDMSTIEKFLAMEHFSIVWPIMSIFLLVSLAGRSLAGQVEQGTVEILLTRPVSRLKIFTAKYLVGMFSLFVFTIFSVFFIVPFGAMHGVDYVFKNFASVALISLLFGWSVFSMAMFFSAVFSERSRAYMATGGILLVMYILNIAAAIKENLVNLKYLSFFHYYDYNDALIRSKLDTAGMLVFIGTAVIFSAAGALWFHKRDIAV